MALPRKGAEAATNSLLRIFSAELRLYPRHPRNPRSHFLFLRRAPDEPGASDVGVGYLGIKRFELPLNDRNWIHRHSGIAARNRGRIGLWPEEHVKYYVTSS